MKKHAAEKTLSPSLFIETINKLAASLMKTDAKVDEIIRKMDTEMFTKAEAQQMIVRMDHDAKEYANFKNKAYVHDHRFNELEPKVASHEKRISALEKKP